MDEYIGCNCDECDCDEYEKRIAEFEADFHRIAEAVLGDIHEGEASVQDVLDYIRRLSDSENQAIDCIAELEARAVDAELNENRKLYEQVASLDSDTFRQHGLAHGVRHIVNEREAAHELIRSMVDNWKNWTEDVAIAKRDVLLPEG